MGEFTAVMRALDKQVAAQRPDNQTARDPKRREARQLFGIPGGGQVLVRAHRVDGGIDLAFQLGIDGVEAQDPLPVSVHLVGLQLAGYAREVEPVGEGQERILDGQNFGGEGVMNLGCPGRAGQSLVAPLDRAGDLTGE